MKILGYLKLGVAVLALTVCSIAKGQSQGAMNAEAGSAFTKADRELNSVYQSILKSYAKQPLFVKNLKAAQRLWVQLRDADLKARYPQSGKYGSAESMCASAYLEKLTKERTMYLKVWLTGIPEGDVCTGSVKIQK